MTIQNSEVDVFYQLQDDADSSPLSAFYPGTGSDLVITSSALAAGTIIKVYAWNVILSCDDELAETVKVDLLIAPVIAIQPSANTTCQGDNATFTVDAGTTTAPTYQWQVSTNGGVSYANLTNAAPYSDVTTATLNITAAPLFANGYLYRVLVGGTCTPVLDRSIRNRFPYLDPLNHLQIELLRQHRSNSGSEQVLHGIQLSINGISAGLRNSG